MTAPHEHPHAAEIADDLDYAAEVMEDTGIRDPWFALYGCPSGYVEQARQAYANYVALHGRDPADPVSVVRACAAAHRAPTVRSLNTVYPTVQFRRHEEATDAG